MNYLLRVDDLGSFIILIILWDDDRIIVQMHSFWRCWWGLGGHHRTELNSCWPTPELLQ